MKSTGLISVAAAALVATIAGVGGTLPVVLAAAQAVGATPDQASSWVSGLGLATAASALLLSVRYRMPIITAWSTPGAALIASTAGVPNFAAAVGAFVLAALLILLTAAVRPIGRLIEKIPASIAAAMLAGILLRLVMAMVEHVPTSPLLVLPLIALFLVARAFFPALVSLIVLVAGALLAWSLGLVKPLPPIGLSTLVVTAPVWDIATLIGLGVPLYLVTMASQNLPGFAVLRGSGYQPPTQPILVVTGAASLGTAFFGRTPPIWRRSPRRYAPAPMPIPIRRNGGRQVPSTRSSGDSSPCSAPRWSACSGRCPRRCSRPSRAPPCWAPRRARWASRWRGTRTAWRRRARWPSPSRASR